MAKTSAQRSNPIEVMGNQAKALLAAWQGIRSFFGGAVENWEVTPEGITAHGFTVNSPYNPEQIVSDISRKERRLEFFPAYLYIQGTEPEPFTESQDMTNFMVQFLKGSVEEGTAKTPAYVREAVATYKSQHGLRTRRGPKRKVIRLDNLDALDKDTLSSVPKEELARLIALAQQVISAEPVAAGR